MRPQLLLITLADLLENLAHAIQVGDLAAHLVDLIGMQGNLAVLGAGIVHIKNPLMMAFAAGAGSAGDASRMKGVALQQGAAKHVVEGWELSNQLTNLLCAFA